MLRSGMRVLTVGNMYPPHHLGGYELVWRDTVTHMRSRGHDVSVLTTTTRLRDDASPDDPWVDRTLRWYWRDHAFPSTSWREARAIERHNRAAVRERIAGGVDAVVWWSMGGLSLGPLEEPRRAGVASGAVVHDAWPVYGPQVDAWSARRRRRRPPYEAVDAWSFNSRWVMEGVLARCPDIDEARCQVDHPGVDLDRLPASPAGPWRGRLACVGRIDERKGIDVAIRALASVPHASLVVTGGGDPDALTGLREEAGRRAVADRVRFDGPADDVASAYAAADAVIFPVTWDEPFGLVPLEAMAVGRPVVATGTGGSAEYLRDEENALLVPPGDADALAAAIRRLASDEDLRRRLVTTGRATAAAHPRAASNAALAAFIERLATACG